jgi:hypothetical protein
MSQQEIQILLQETFKNGVKVVQKFRILRIIMITLILQRNIYL